MSKLKAKINGINIFEHDYDNWKERETSSLEADGAAFRFAEWLRVKGLTEETDVDVFNNLSGLRNGNRLDLMDNYSIFDPEEKLEITYLYIVNGNVWAVLYDTENKDYYGDFEIPHI